MKLADAVKEGGPVPARLRAIVQDERVIGWSNEAARVPPGRAPEDVHDGYWVYLAPGWCADPGLHTVHEWTVDDLRRAWAGVSACEGDCDCRDA